jgi:hypothetical protein
VKPTALPFRGLLLPLLVALGTPVLRAQTGPSAEGPPPTAYVVLQPVTIQPTADPAALAHYRRTVHHVRKVYPYAIEALEQMIVLDSVAAVAERKRDARRFRRQLERELEDRFKADLKQLTRSQGRILIAMVERQTGEQLYYTLKDVKNGFTAFWWQTLAGTYDIDLKAGYDPTADPVLEALLQDLEWPPVARRDGPRD